MATKHDFKAAQDRIFARPRPESVSDQELLRKTEDDGVYPSPLNVKAIRLDHIVADAGRPPRTFSEQSLLDLGQSLLAQGQIMPILVQYQSDDDVFVLVDGERRWRAAQKVGLPSLQAIIIGRMTPAERYEQRMAVALHQAEWDACERVQALEAYKTLKNLPTWTDVAHDLGISDATLQSLLEAPASAADATPGASGAIGRAMAAIDLLEHALSCLRPRQAGKAEIARRLDELTERVAEQRARLQQNKPKPQSETKNPVEGAGKPVRHMPTWDQR